MQEYTAYVEKVVPVVLPYVISFVAALLIFIIGKWIANMITRVVERMMINAKVDKTLSTFARHILYYGIMVFVALAALGKLGIQTTSFMAVIGAAGLAVGLALQGSLANFAAGVMLILFMPFKAGDVVEAGGAMGTVEEVQIFSTIMMTADKKKVIVPNSKITADKIVIHSHA